MSNVELVNTTDTMSVDDLAARTVIFKLVPELPLVNSHAFDIVAVVNNKDTVRVSWNSLTSNYISQTQDVPSEPGVTNDIPYITFAADETGLYVNDGTSWRKSPSYGGNWDDLTENTRFLLVNSPMELTDEEVENARQSLKLGIATDTKLGLVKAYPAASDAITAESVKINNDGSLVIEFATPIVENAPEGVPGVVRLKNYYSTDITEDGTYAVTEHYVREAIANYSANITLPIASETSLGTIMVDSGTPLTISESGTLSINDATSTSSGVVFLDEAADIDTATDSHAASVGLVNTIVERRITDISSQIAGVNLGMVRVPGDTAITIDGVGNIDVRTATATAPGAVVMLGELDPNGNYSNVDTGSTAVTPQAVTNYVENKLSNLPQILPIASAKDLGAIRVGSGVTIDEDTGVLDVTNATPARLGGVYVSLAVNDTNSTTVPTEGRVLELINSNVPELNTARINRYGTVKLSLPDVIEDGAKIGVNAYGQIVAEKTTSSTGGEIGIAAKDTLGLVALSSSNTVGAVYSGYGLPIGSDEGGAIYVDASNPASYATTARPGLVTLSVSRSEVLPTTNPGIGVDANGQLRVKGSISGGGGSTSDFNYYFYKKDEPSSGDYSPVYYYTSDTWRMPFVPAASASYPGVVRLGTSTKVEGGFPVGVNESGTLCVAINTTGDGTVVGPATAESSGVVKLGQDDVIDNGLRVGVNANGQLCVASTSTSMTTATFTLAGAVTLSTPDTYAAGTFGVVGVDDTNGKLAVPAATSESYGVVKVGGNVLDTSDPTVALVGRTSEGQLAVKGVSSGGGTIVQTSDASLQVTLLPVEDATPGSYIVTMTGGAIQLNDGNIVNIEAITKEDNIVITPSNNQTLSLKVFINNDGEPVAKLTLDSSTKVLTCKPFMG